MRSLQRTISPIFVFSVLILFAGCKKDSTTAPAPAINGDIFPIAQGHVYVYTESDIDANRNPIAGTDHRVATLVGPAVTIAGRTGHYLIDSIYTTGGILGRIDTFNIASKDPDRTVYFTLPESAFPDLPFRLSATWFPLFQPGAGEDNGYDIYRLDTTIVYQSISMAMNIKLRGVIGAQETVQVPAGPFQAYTGTVTYEYGLSSMGISAPPETGLAIKMWLVDGVGPVKILNPGDETVRLLAARNF